MRDKNLRTQNKLNTPYRTNSEYAKKHADKINSHEYSYEFGKDDSRYDYEFGNSVNLTAKDSPLARGANIADAFSYPSAGSAQTDAYRGDYGKYNEEYTLDQSDNSALQNEVNANGLKKKYQENLKQNYNVEFSDDELIDDNCDDCDNCPRCHK